MKTARMELGKRGEDAVSEYLIGKGHMVIGRNWRSGHLEVDLITISEDGLHFVEVKSRMAPYTAEPELAVNATKQKKIIAAAKAWLRSAAKKNAGLAGLELFFDVASVVFDGDDVELRYFPRAYMPVYY